MSVKSGQALALTFVTSHATTGAAADATGTPAGALYVNGAATADAVTVTKPAGTGIYKAAVTLPVLAVGDTVAIHITATVDGIAGAGFIFQDVADTYVASDIEALVDDVESRLTADRAGYLDKLQYLPAVAAGNAGGVFIAGANAATTITTALTTTFTGNVTGTVGGIAGTLTTIDALWAKIQKWLRLALRKDAATATDCATELTEINANGGSGAGAYANTTDAQEAIRDTEPLGTAMRGTDGAVLATTVGVAGAGLTALGDTRIANLDAAVSTRSSHSAADVWSVATRTLTSFGTLVADIWSYATRTLTSISVLVAGIADALWDELLSGHTVAGSAGKALSDAGAAGDPWSAATRTLTQSAASVAAAVAGSEITVYRGDTWSISLTGLGAITGYLDVWFCVKDSPTQTDAEALLLASTSVGLEILNGAEGTAGQATLVVDDASAGNITLTVLPAATALIAEGANRVYDVQWKTAAGAIHTLTADTFNVSGDVTRAIT